uniref:Uncharacterized protein n=1 Tax=Arundo donax TaxID=35708 RepID=A0A0A9D4D1_ARUDO
MVAEEAEGSAIVGVQLGRSEEVLGRRRQEPPLLLSAPLLLRPRLRLRAAP